MRLPYVRPRLVRLSCEEGARRFRRGLDSGRMPVVWLVLIAKNEAHVIGRALASAPPGVARALVVVDEATVDATADVARAAGALVYVRAYRGNLAAARNEALELAAQGDGGQRPDYALMLDCDDVYRGMLPRELSADLYDVWIHDHGARHLRPQLVRLGIGAHYKGVRHELLVGPEGCSRSIAPALVYERIGGGAEEKRPRRERFLEHARDLEAWLEQNPDDARATFMLGQTYRDAGELEAARVHYERRLAMGPPSEEEAYLSALELAFLVEGDDGPVGALLAAFLRCHELQPLRAEPLFHLACALRERGAVACAWHFARRAAELRMPERGTIVDEEVYEWKAAAEVAIESWMLGDQATAMKLLVQIARERPRWAEWAHEQLHVVTTTEPPERSRIVPFMTQPLAKRRVDL